MEYINQVEVYDRKHDVWKDIHLKDSEFKDGYLWGAEMKVFRPGKPFHLNSVNGVKKGRNTDYIFIGVDNNYYITQNWKITKNRFPKEMKKKWQEE